MLKRENDGYAAQSFIPYAERFISEARRLVQRRNLVNPSVESAKHID